MKTTLTLLTLLLLTSCGRPNIEACDGDLTYNLCKLFYNPIGSSRDKEIEDIKSDIIDIENSFDSEIDGIISRVEIVEQGTVTELIDPCGDDQGFYDEVLLRIGDDKLIALFVKFGSNGKVKETFLSEIGPGSYITTDNQKCRFSVNSELEVNED